jgi:hypothetical protein
MDQTQEGTMKNVAALYVQKNGCYFGLEGVDPWDEQRDARTYKGPHPVVAHPPCARWSRYWHGGPSVKVRRMKGDDDGCFAHSLWAVRTFGGVIEHPEASAAWKWHGLTTPPKTGGWVKADDFGGWTCCVEQVHYGHRARKATWLYVCGVPEHLLPDLIWGPGKGTAKLDQGFHSAEERRKAVRRGVTERLSKNQMEATPDEFRNLLIDIARMAQ